MQTSFQDHSNTMNDEHIGTIIIGIEGFQLTATEKRWLQHPMVAGVILFTRNYQNREQLHHLCQSILHIDHHLLISVDQEGGRVQRFREEFTTIPPMQFFGEIYKKAADEAINATISCGYLIAAELKSLGIDFSYAPVCDIDYQNNAAIGNRAFSRNITAVCQLSQALHQGLKEAGSIGVAKHFPGHGFVALDSHAAIPRDTRSLEDLQANDLRPFIHLITQNIEAMMPAHIIFDALDQNNTILNSPKWLNYLRHELNFKGLIISDDMNMKGANNIKGDDAEKAKQCFKNGVDVLLCCNQKTTIELILSAFNDFDQHPNQKLIKKLHALKNTQEHPFDLSQCALWQKHHRHLEQFIQTFSA